jgi:hypothetical protein
MTGTTLRRRSVGGTLGRHVGLPETGVTDAHEPVYVSAA